MANLEIEGTLVRKFPIQNGQSTRGPWQKQEFLVEFPDGNYRSTAIFNVWGDDKVRDLSNFNDGEQVKVSFGISSREYNGRYYTELRAWRIVRADAAQPQAPAPAPQSGYQSDMPAGFAPRQTVPPPTLGDMPGAPDDLPF